MKNKDKAIVFDNSGTLLKRLRAIKNMETGEISQKASSLKIVDEIGDSVLVVIQTDIKKSLLKSNEKERLYDFLKNNDIKLDISYSSVKIGKDKLLPCIKKDETKLKDFHQTAKYLSEKNSYIELCSGSAFILNVKSKKISYVITAGGKIFPKVRDVVNTLKKRNIDVFIASGDSYESLQELAELINLPKENVFDTANTQRKKEIIESLKKDYKVMMVGNDTNDILAFKEADLAILTLEQNEKAPDEVFEAADIVINNIEEVLNIEF